MFRTLVNRLPTVAAMPVRSPSLNVASRLDEEILQAYPRIAEVLTRNLKIVDLSYQERVALNLATYQNGSKGRRDRKRAAAKALQNQVNIRLAELNEVAKVERMQQLRALEVRRSERGFRRLATQATRAEAKKAGTFMEPVLVSPLSLDAVKSSRSAGPAKAAADAGSAAAGEGKQGKKAKKEKAL